MSEWSEFYKIVEEHREKEIITLAVQAKLPISVERALIGAMTVARVVLEHRKKVEGAEVAACLYWTDCENSEGRPCPFLDLEDDECGIPRQSDEDIEHAMKVYRGLYDRMPSKYKRTSVVYVETD